MINERITVLSKVKNYNSDDNAKFSVEPEWEEVRWECCLNIEGLLENHSALRVMPLQKQRKSSPVWAVRYMLGIKGENDHLLAQLADASDYPAKKDVSVDLLYTEKGGTGDILTYIEIDTLQDTQEGNAHVVSGGIGQRSIHIVLEAKQTERFSYNAHFYGRKTLKLMTH
ncbi:hypothetical protein GQX74_010087 [Glossina fuscipes]|nr:hypothetical protein GQX74_010087 [Glossina fuscipes]